MRELSTRMIEAVLEGSGLQGVAELAAGEVGVPVAILLPGRGLVAREPSGGELLGCDLARDAIALVAENESASPSPATALVEAEYDGSLAELAEGRLYAILPARGGDDAPELTLQGAGRIARRLRKHGQAAVSSFYPDPGELHRAVREAELVPDVITREPTIAALEEGIAASRVYRLLFRALISDPEEVRSFYRDTVEPLVRYDDQYRSDLLGVPLFPSNRISDFLECCEAQPDVAPVPEAARPGRFASLLPAAASLFGWAIGVLASVLLLIHAVHGLFEAGAPPVFGISLPTGVEAGLTVFAAIAAIGCCWRAMRRVDEVAYSNLLERIARIDRSEPSPRLRTKRRALPYEGLR